MNQTPVVTVVEGNVDDGGEFWTSNRGSKGLGVGVDNERPLNGAADKRPYRCGQYVTVITVSI